MRALVSSLLLLAASAAPASAVVKPTGARMVSVPAGSFHPLYGKPSDGAVPVAAFRLDRDAVTRGEFLAFVQSHPTWRRSAVKPVFAERASYLAGWRGDLDATSGSADDLRRPVTGVSWFAARAYCSAQGKRLPTMLEWEYAAAASRTRRDASRDPAFVQELVSLYAQRRLPAATVDAGRVNAYGARGLHDGPWEWVEDFNGVLVSDDSRASGSRDHDLFCASAAIGAADPSNYPAFLRHALRAGLTGRTSLETLGFRCAL